MALAYPTSGFGGMANTALSMLRRRPLAPLAVSTAAGQTSAVPPPTQSRVPTGTIFSRVQQMVQNRPTSSFPTLFKSLQQRAPTAPAPAPATAPKPAAAQPPAPNIAPPAPQPPAANVPAPNVAPAAPPPSAPAPQPPPGQFGEVVRDIQGNERPQQILPGQSATAPLQDRAQQEAMRALESPSPYDDQLFQQEVQRARGSFDADIASRGLDYSSIAPQEFSRQVLNPLLSERARTISEARRNALAGAQSVIGQRTGLEQGGREELRGERGYTDTLREQARRNAIDQYQLGESQFQQTLQQALASGDPSRALAALQSAAYGMGGPAAAYGQQAEQSGAGLQELAQSFIEQFYGNRGAQ
jgi:hypothetical protein